MTREIFARQLIVPTVGASQIPMQVALPYAALLLEKRQGHVGFVPATAVAAGKAPRTEEHTSELQSLMRLSYAALSLNKTTDRTQPDFTSNSYSSAHTQSTRQCT